ncbi:hypothetical protein [Rhodanobacter sp. MP7CTX1]|uniref:hypothetical protein n=1 Tax=Rhodanobacter sp. MP7CTX1 TaxID=2723084 RepID=UPI00160BC1C9|nr:hypothetical protein [Rhodanobacter sp. MP7CTX1]MBB6186532.1 hypothetical protein [Rhodanobacter sp. MP7CTX1]
MLPAAKPRTFLDRGEEDIRSLGCENCPVFDVQSLLTADVFKRMAARATVAERGKEAMRPAIMSGSLQSSGTTDDLAPLLQGL